MLKHLFRWLAAHDDLPTMDVPSAVVDDDTTEAWSDELYLRGLLDDLVRTCVDTGLSVRPLSAIHSAVLELSIEELRDDAMWLIEVPA